MKRLAALITILIFTSSIALSHNNQEPPKCQECETTWTQWFGATAALAMAYGFVSSKLPILGNFNTLVIGKAAEISSAVSVCVMSRWAGKANVE